MVGKPVGAQGQAAHLGQGIGAALAGGAGVVRQGLAQWFEGGADSGGVLHTEHTGQADAAVIGQGERQCADATSSGFGAL